MDELIVMRTLDRLAGNAEEELRFADNLLFGSAAGRKRSGLATGGAFCVDGYSIPAELYRIATLPSCAGTCLL